MYSKNQFNNPADIMPMPNETFFLGIRGKDGGIRLYPATVGEICSPTCFFDRCTILDKGKLAPRMTSWDDEVVGWMAINQDTKVYKLTPDEDIKMEMRGLGHIIK